MKRITFNKRTSLITLVSIICVLVAGVYTWQSLRAWSDYEARLMSEQTTYEQLKDTALNGKTADERLKAIRSLDDKLAKRSELCRMNALFAWQASIIPPLKAGVKQCEDKVRQLGLVAGPLSALRDYLEASAKVQEIINELTPGDTLNDSNWVEKGLEKAKVARDKLKEVPVTGDAAKLRDQAAKLSGSLVSSWESLIKANDAKDKTAFLAASAAVSQAYAEYMSLADVADEQIEAKVRALTKAAEGI